MATGIPSVGAAATSVSEQQTVTDAIAGMIGAGLVSQQQLLDSVFDPTKELLNEAYSD